VALAAVPVIVIAVTSFVGVPYYAIVPGDARPVNNRVTITGVQTYPTSGSTLFVTVGVPKLTALGRLLGNIDPHADVLPQERIVGTQTPEENQKENVRLMSYSKDFATYVALSKLGFPVSVSGGGVVINSLCMQPSTDGKSCVAESPAAAELKPDDVITSINDKPVHLVTDVATALQGKQPGDKVDVTVTRAKQTDNLTGVELTKSSDGRTILGIVPKDGSPDDLKFSFPIDVKINSGQVSGPSAGLAFTLTLLDELTPGSLTGGMKVAATGEISPTGQVLEIGGLPQKTEAVLRAGASMFLVPKSEMQDAVNAAKGTSLKIVGVETVDDALKALAAIPGSNAASLGTPGASFTPH
jgi:PDZ domain-containing protein